MARIRTIKPQFWLSATVAKLPYEARLLFIALWNQADDEGRLRLIPRFLLGQIFPYDPITEEGFLGMVNMLEDLGLVKVYSSSATGEDFMVINGFSEHQYLRNPKPSELPAPNGRYPRKSAKRTDQGRLTANKSVTKGELTGSFAGEMREMCTRNKEQGIRNKDARAREAAVVAVDPYFPSAEKSAVIEHWRTTFGKQAVSPQDEHKTGLALLAFSVAELKQAIDGWATDDWGGRSRNCSLRTLLRDDEQIKRGLQLAETRAATLAADRLLLPDGESVKRTPAAEDLLARYNEFEKHRKTWAEFLEEEGATYD